MSEQSRSYLFTSESVTEGHPDKVCDQISDAILDALLEKEIQLAEEGYVAPDGSPANPELFRCACETLATTGMIFVTGEIRTQAYVDTIEIVRGVLKDIGYDRAKYGFDCATCGVLNAIHDQSPDIAQGVDASFESQSGQALDPYDQVGAGDQGMVFGYACDDTKTLMPMPIYLAHRLSERLAKVRKDETMPYLRPDGKTQVSVRYVDGVPTQVEKVVVSTQHSEEVDPEFLRSELLNHVINPVFEEEQVTVSDDVEIFVNPTGRFVIGGPMGDAGLTGRKIIVDTYGGYARHGGGAFSGKDPTKVDRSAAYMARYIAKNVVAANMCDELEIQLSYAIGVKEPTSIYIDTKGTEKVPHDVILEAIKQEFDLTPAGIIHTLNLRTPIYKKTASYGHFGRPEANLPWEQLDKVENLKKYM